MTQPLVDRGVFRRVGECPTPWPCFVIAVRNEVLLSEKETLQKLLAIINSATIDFKNQPNIASLLAQRFHQKPEDIEQWLSFTEWSQAQLTAEQLINIQYQLLELQLIDKKSNFDTIVSVI